MKMSNAVKIYKEIIADLKKPENSGYAILNRSILLKNKIRIIYFVATKDMHRIIAVMLPKDIVKEPLNRFPKWHGIEFSYENISEYKNKNSEYEYIVISQSKDYDSGIFEIVANDITVQIEKLSDSDKVFRCLSDTLSKWKKFFSINSDVIMSEKLQQGLYGELLVLKKLIFSYGQDAVVFWSGAGKETHDFYVNGSAIEVKTTALKSYEKIKISSEHQLNPKDVDGSLFLYVNMVRSSRTDGETLPMIIESISKKLSESSKELFFEKLFQYGYVPACEEKYVLGFHLRLCKTYKVEESFPNIVPAILNNGISEVTYSLDLNICSEYIISWDEIINNLNGGADFGET